MRGQPRQRLAHGAALAASFEAAVEQAGIARQGGRGGTGGRLDIVVLLVFVVAEGAAAERGGGVIMYRASSGDWCPREEGGGQTVGRRRSGQSSGPKLFSPIYVFGSHMLLLEREGGWYSAGAVFQIEHGKSIHCSPWLDFVYLNIFTQLATMTEYFSSFKPTKNRGCD